MKKLALLLIVTVFLYTGCNKDNPSTEIQSKTFEVKSTSSTAWTYFSFDKNDTIQASDPMSSGEWDLAFQRYRIKTNGGQSGKGQGAAANSYSTGLSGFNSLTVVPDTTTFVADAPVTIAVQQGYATYVVNPVLYTWFSIQLASQGTQIVPSDYIYIVRTARGRYAKVWFKSYYNAQNQSGHVSFQYKYQPDGSKNLE
ncbi:MAG TPA: HmuY family protein [Bacteroidales bacterium]|nr:HmuY family protein [Bacteroidales bacterium]